jgi:hypothetical protein
MPHLPKSFCFGESSNSSYTTLKMRRSVSASRTWQKPMASLKRAEQNILGDYMKEISLNLLPNSVNIIQQTIPGALRNLKLMANALTFFSSAKPSTSKLLNRQSRA